jgi:2-phospho-L-lactate transferase/gluconeogenesis factor (CofD/UPF0052 family)/glycosyltransferase involved in cell wall biosynthesis
MGRVVVSIFAGGRGAATICDAFAEHPQIELKVLVNAYDDGLSTGRIRGFVRGFLGPSDIRKNVARLIPGQDASQRALKFLLEYRLPVGITEDRARKVLELLYRERLPDVPDELYERVEQTTVADSRKIQELVSAFLRYCEEERRVGRRFDFSDCALGNILLAGCYLQQSRSFNRAVDTFQRFARNVGRVINVTRGEPYVLVALKDNGSLLKDEAGIVSRQASSRIADLFLLEEYLTGEETTEFARLGFEQRRCFLAARDKTPRIGDEARDALAQADLIVYGPGTQHSSLFPSYLTEGVAEAIQANQRAEKIFVSNIRKDHEIQSETTNSLASKLVWFLSRKGSVAVDPSDLVNRFFFQAQEDPTDGNYVEFASQQFDFCLDNVLLENWEESDGRHSGGRVLNELIAIVNEKAKAGLRSIPYMVSIVVPALNEERTVGKVLHDLVLLNFQPYGLAKEIVFVDGGSSDATMEIARREEAVRCYQLPTPMGRGAALRFGAERARGNVIVFFPSDGEYESTDLFSIVQSVVQGEFRAVFGSRMIKCGNYSERIRDIYKGDYVGYLISKYGGLALSLLSLLLYKRFVMDPLTGIKAFDGRLFRKLELKSRGVELETEIIAALAREGEYILEMPVSYSPRLRSQGKKVTLGDGIRTLLKLVQMRFSRHEKGDHRYPSIQRGEVYRTASREDSSRTNGAHRV